MLAVRTNITKEKIILRNEKKEISEICSNLLTGNSKSISVVEKKVTTPDKVKA
jgi:hypothetical protein